MKFTSIFNVYPSVWLTGKTISKTQCNASHFLFVKCCIVREKNSNQFHEQYKLRKTNEKHIFKEIGDFNWQKMWAFCIETSNKMKDQNVIKSKKNVSIKKKIMNMFILCQSLPIILSFKKNCCLHHHVSHGVTHLCQWCKALSVMLPYFKPKTCYYTLHAIEFSSFKRTCINFIQMVQKSSSKDFEELRWILCFSGGFCKLVFASSFLRRRFFATGLFVFCFCASSTIMRC